MANEPTKELRERIEAQDKEIYRQYKERQDGK